MYNESDNVSTLDQVIARRLQEMTIFTMIYLFSIMPTQFFAIVLLTVSLLFATS